MTNIFAGTPERPYHMSIGAVLVDENGKFLAHKYDIKKVSLLEAKNRDVEVLPLDTFYTIMTETPEESEGMLEALHRGCMEEFGAEVEVIGFIGTHLGHFSRPSTPDISIEKTIPFFLCRILTLDDSKRPEGEIESQSEAILIDPEELAVLLERQFEVLKRTDSDLAHIVRRAKNLL